MILEWTYLVAAINRCGDRKKMLIATDKIIVHTNFIEVCFVHANHIVHASNTVFYQILTYLQFWFHAFDM